MGTIVCENRLAHFFNLAPMTNNFIYMHLVMGLPSTGSRPGQ